MAKYKEKSASPDWIPVAQSAEISMSTPIYGFESGESEPTSPEKLQATAASKKKTRIPRHDAMGFTTSLNDPANRALFLETIAETGSIVQACDAVGCSRQTAHTARQDPDFAEDFVMAKQRFSAALREEARRRAVEGVAEPMLYQGEVVAVRMVKDTKLLHALMQANDDEYRAATKSQGSNITVNASATAGVVQQQVTLNPADMTPEQRQLLAQLLGSLPGPEAAQPALAVPQRAVLDVPVTEERDEPTPTEGHLVSAHGKPSGGI